MESKKENMKPIDQVLNFCACGERLTLSLDKLHDETLLFFGCNRCNCGFAVTMSKRSLTQIENMIK